MAFTMHSHSGQFCPGHAKDQLEDIVKHAISLGYTTMGLTEHMPRTDLEDLYPEELDDPEANLAILFPRHASYITEAIRLQRLYAPQIHILIGFEGEWLRPAYASTIADLLAHPAVDYFIGSLHHVNGIPIDFDRALYEKAMRSVSSPGEQITTTSTTTEEGGGGEKEEGEKEAKLFERYFDQQHEMLTALKPKVVGHFDLIRLFDSDWKRDVRTTWPGVWERIRRNLRVVAGYGGWLECNSSALRKGMPEPYPCRVIAEEWLSLGGKFTLSDDSHGIAQLGTNYGRALGYLSSLGVSSVWTLQRDPHPHPSDKDENEDDNKEKQKAQLTEKEVKIADIKAVVAKW
ncbi:histidinol-phosphatase [Xylariomycetidae sp. FL2044]|nr:histidinol-phosphatase [Xylariomycetidae sp. FL2044]